MTIRNRLSKLKKLGKETNTRYLEIRREIGKAFVELEQDKAVLRNYGIYIE